jgi:hypothetical protein
MPHSAIQPSTSQYPTPYPYCDSLRPGAPAGKTNTS